MIPNQASIKYTTRKSQCERCNKAIELKHSARLFLCDKCRKQRCLKLKLNKFKELKVENEYSEYLFELYLNYVDRFYLTYQHIKQVQNLLEYFSLKDIGPLLSWRQVFIESEDYDKKYKENKFAVGRPLIKIGKMLAELGVLPPKSEDRSQYYIRILKKYPENLLETINGFIDFEKEKNLLDMTIILHLELILTFINWSSLRLSPEPEKDFDINLISEVHIKDHLNHLKHKGHPQTFVISAFTGLSNFFKWCKLKNIILVNPCENIKLKKPQEKLIICDDNTVKKLMKFIKSPKSNPEQALILALILIWGLRSQDLSHARIEVKENNFKIILRRKKLGTIKYYNRSQILDLPSNQHSWFYLLQKKFYKSWLLQYKQLKKSFPCYYLLLPRNRSVLPLTKSTVKARVYEATQAAAGMNIPLKVLRKTCGHIHSTSSDASILSTLGWSSNYCFEYTWTPKIYYQESK